MWSFQQLLRILTGSLFFILLGMFLLFIAFWSSGSIPAGITLLNVILVALIILGVGSAFFAADGKRVDQFYRFCSSGLFFIIFGAFLLFLAHWSMGTAHAGMSFVLVVLGVAVLLYGTGTQGMGEFKTDAAASKYNVAIAGGAGVLAFCVALGIIWYSPQMRAAFQTEKKYVRLLIKSADGSSNIPSYVPTFEIDGVPIPAARRGNLVEVFVPYHTSELASAAAPAGSRQQAAEQSKVLADASKGVCPDQNVGALAKLDETTMAKTISAIFYRVESKDTLKPKAETTFQIWLAQSLFNQRDGGADYPLYPVQMCVNLQAQDSLNTVINRAGSELRAAAGKERPQQVPESILNQIGVQ